MEIKTGRRAPWRRQSLLCALLLLAFAGPAAAEEKAEKLAPPIEDVWSYADETSTAESPGARQARASIYRGDHLVALRCHAEAERRWESLVFGATWFLHPKSHLTFELRVDEQPAVMVEFQRETDYRFAADNPPRQLIAALGEGSELSVGGPDFAGAPVVVPLKGSRAALDGAFALCGYDPVPN